MSKNKTKRRIELAVVIILVGLIISQLFFASTKLLADEVENIASETETIVEPIDSEETQQIADEVENVGSETEEIVDLIDLEETQQMSEYSAEQNNLVSNPNLQFSDKDTTIPNWKIQGADKVVNGTQILTLGPPVGDSRKLIWVKEKTEVTLKKDAIELSGSNSGAEASLIYSQEIDTVPGSVYELSFEYKKGITHLMAHDGKVSSGPNSLVTLSLPRNDDYVSTGRRRFVARSKTTTVSFRSQGVAGEFGVKNVQVVKRDNIISNPNLLFKNEDQTIPEWNIFGVDDKVSLFPSSLKLESPINGLRKLKWPGTEYTKVELETSASKLKGITESEQGTVIFSQTIKTLPAEGYEYNFSFSGNLTSAAVYDKDKVSGPGGIAGSSLAEQQEGPMIEPIRFIAKSSTTTVSFRSQAKSGKFGANDVVVIKLDKAAPISVEFVDEAGIKLSESISLSDGFVGDPYTTEPVKIVNYQVKTIPENKNGSFTNTPQTVTYVYEKIEGAPVTVKYEDESGKELAASDNLKGYLGDSYETKAKEIPNYKLKTTPSNANGVYTGKEQTVTYVYENIQGAPVRVKYQDDNDEELAPSEIINGYIGESYEAKIKEIKGYRLEEVPENANGFFTEKEQEVIFVYDLANINPVDPLDPSIDVNPENRPDLSDDQGELSIDFVSKFTFGERRISIYDQEYYAKPQRLIDDKNQVIENSDRPNYVQITDRRKNREGGWQLAVTQNQQFTSIKGDVLKGVELILNHQQLATAQGGKSPELVGGGKPTALIPGNRQPLLLADKESGSGTWVYRFGDDTTYDKGVALSLPAADNPKAIGYSTTLTWELSNVPVN